MKSLNTFITEAYTGSVFNKEDAHYTLADWKRWEKKYEKDYNIFYDEKIQCYLIYTKTKGNVIGKHIATYNSIDGILYYDKGEFEDPYPVS